MVKPTTTLPILICASAGNHGLAVAAAAELAGTRAKVYLPADASEIRAQRLRDRGAELRGWRDLSLVLFVLVELAEESRQALEGFETTIGSRPEVVEAHYVSGEADVVLKLRLSDIGAYNRFVEMHVNASALVRRFKTLTVLPTSRGITQAIETGPRHQCCSVLKDAARPIRADGARIIEDACASLGLVPRRGALENPAIAVLGQDYRLRSGEPAIF